MALALTGTSGSIGGAPAGTGSLGPLQPQSQTGDQKSLSKSDAKTGDAAGVAMGAAASAQPMSPTSATSKKASPIKDQSGLVEIVKAISIISKLSECSRDRLIGSRERLIDLVCITHYVYANTLDKATRKIDYDGDINTIFNALVTLSEDPDSLKETLACYRTDPNAFLDFWNLPRTVRNGIDRATKKPIPMLTTAAAPSQDSPGNKSGKDTVAATVAGSKPADAMTSTKSSDKSVKTADGNSKKEDCCTPKLQLICYVVGVIASLIFVNWGAKK